MSKFAESLGLDRTQYPKDPSGQVMRFGFGVLSLGGFRGFSGLGVL